MAGETELAANALQELRCAQPNISLDWLLTQMPIKEPAEMQHYYRGLPPRQSGMRRQRPPARLSDHLDEQPDHADPAEHEDQRADEGPAGEVDDRVGDAQPEIADSPESRHGVRLAGRLHQKNQRRKRSKRFHGVEVGAVRTLAPKWQRTLLRIDIVLRGKKAVCLHLR